jgi:chemotaxis methyl-accepting protein methylase
MDFIGTDVKRCKDNLDGIRFAGKPIQSASRRRLFSASINKRRELQPNSEEETADSFQSWILAKAGLDARNYRAKPLNRRMTACLRALKAKDSQEACQLLEKRPEQTSKAIDSLLIGATEFFRDEDVFHLLKSSILPDIIKSGRRVKIWSAACSNGSELASVAILLSEAGALEKSTLLGTDCRESAIRDARSGIYDESCLKNVKSEFRDKYFQPEGNRYLFMLPAGRCMSWKVADLFSGGQEKNYDLILCRNLAIYLNLKASNALWKILAGSLRSGGYLITGKTERPDEPFSCISRGVYRKSGVS